MNAIYILIAIVSLIFLLNCACSKGQEGFRGRRHRRGRGRGRFWDGPQAYLHRFRRRRPRFRRSYFWDYDDNCWEILTNPKGGYTWLFEQGDQVGKGHMDKKFERPGVKT